ncbi:23S rRNA (cytidine-2'-O)-methyltransferase TlyA [Poseidonibacter ostreae]|jgi:23S rRNA (cytidine1920-2'-O)/16S rRNA (cytidine1409-2'-O)-methyltransferase|uniref:TlyA family rRNA (Cytidine-2'-O)-methyltransferase n=1 Tax=Poseidonibacter ostreae TaxID=2654171 RepID=A0A6L4WP19_9BACT|nr:TlyA family RNA methyltransferase [Poseidonibacter ostreae]KAB7884606.1 TlyA family rRNA (cytidine-2'-O)-methyltransferase [Poseidonibacter ostreae]KAB7885564.1 TlyA family rRNA (cytidine-2'-O)-methyltransferase [Poseidonibacter ostreae]KAB7888538.1 TlyA family rRNA (cytidine-2'-O)-methyltransferase [Poseidonibacter ostreae]
MRLDQYLTIHYDIQSRNKAAELIKAGKIQIDGKIVKKSSFDINETSEIKILEDDFFVSRAAYKLKYFLEELSEVQKLSILDKNTLDIGSSTGGFTQILLLNNAKKVTCVDVGSNQLHEKIKNEDKISFFENTDIRDFVSDEIFDVVTCDVSFISILYIIEDINRLSSKDIIILFKPQFEVGTNVKRDKKGVVKDKKAIGKAKEKFIAYTEQLNWKLKYSSMSKLQGKDGNEEELFYFSK